MAFYRARFADASRFTFVFAGSFTPEMLKPLVETYIASLPATNGNETWRDVGITAPRGVVEKTIEKGVAPRSEVSIIFTGPFQYDDAHILALRAMTMVLESRLFDSIRQELGGTYSIGATPTSQNYPKGEFSVRIDWTCDPARTNALVQRVFDEIRFVRNTTFTSDQVSRIRSVLIRDFEQNSQSNSYILNQISRRFENGEGADDLSTAIDVRGQIARLTADQIQQAARTYLDTANYLKVTLLPEKPAK